MRPSSRAIIQLPLLALLFGLAACDSAEPGSPSGDAGSRTADAGVGTRDGEVRLPDGEVTRGCESGADCDDGDSCTEDRCEAGVCTHRSSCGGCATNADCDFGHPCIVGSCRDGECHGEVRDGCCVNDSFCDDDDPATYDVCNPDHTCTSERRACDGHAVCDDGERCTEDRCGADGFCERTMIPDCGPPVCADMDGDGFGGILGCPPGVLGDDCDDTNPLVHPGAVEICDDSVDNDCDARRDRIDEDCAHGARTCSAARTLSPGAPVSAWIRDDGSSSSAARCGHSQFYTLTLTETADVQVELVLERPVPPPPPCPDCPAPDGPEFYYYEFNAFLQTTCGDVSTDLLPSTRPYCFQYDSTGWGRLDATTRAASVPAGTHTLEVQISDGWADSISPTMIPYRLEVTLLPPTAP